MAMAVLGVTSVRGARAGTVLAALPDGASYAVVPPATPIAGILDPALHAEPRISGTPAPGRVSDLSGPHLGPGSRPAFQIRARSRDKTRGHRQQVCQLVLPDGNAPHVVPGVAGNARYPRVAEEILGLGISLEIGAPKTPGGLILALAGTPR